MMTQGFRLRRTHLRIDPKADENYELLTSCLECLCPYMLGMFKAYRKKGEDGGHLV